MDHNLEELRQVVDTWQQMRTHESNTRDLRKFVELHNNMSRRVISNLGRQDPDFYIALMELASHASTLVTPQAKIFADGIDRTNL